MSRMILTSSLLLLALPPGISATDGCITPYNKRPFNSPKAPCPSGILSDSTCFGYFQTKWTPWQLACTGCSPSSSSQPPATTLPPATPVSSSSGSRGIILYEQPARVTPSGPLMSSTEQVRVLRSR
ncbi:MAG TPA: hypothetical protein PKA06_12105 [Gemmatales bacterium]|nr:hypothetical protein [Gemmatales bacterium]